MSSTVDSRIVTAKFDNKQFEAGASKTLATLNLLAKGLDFLASRKGMADISKQAAQTNLSPLASSVEGVSARFLALSTIAVTALSNITNRAINAGTKLVKSFTIEPMTGALDEYELKLSTIKTVMSGTGESIGEVGSSIKLLDEYADSTIYSLQDMVANIKHFTNAGVDSKRAAEAIKGVAQVAALSGASAQEAAGAMYQLGKSLGQGFVGLMDWNSVETAGMATMEFKQQLIDTAVAMGTLKKASDGTIKTLKGNEVDTKQFAYTLKDQWLTAEALTETLNRYSDKQSEIGKKAYSAAQDVSKFSQVMSIAKESIGTTWGDSFEIMIGNLPKATKLWSGLSNYIGQYIQDTADARNETLESWRQMGGRKDAIAGIKAGFQALLSVIDPIKDAFRDIFPRKSASDLAAMTASFRKFMEGLSLSGKNADNLRATFRGFFAVLDIGWQIIKGFIGVVAGLFGSMAGADKNILDVTGSIGDFLVSVRDTLKEGGALESFFDGLGKVLEVPMKLIGALSDGLSTAFDYISKLSLDPIIDAFGGFGDGVKGVLSGDINGILALISTGLLGGIFLLLKNFFTGGGLLDALIGGKAGGLVSSLTETFGAVTDTLQTMQQNVRANVILKIAAAMALLVGSIAILSTIPGKDIAKSMAAVTAGFGQLLIAMAIMTKIAGIKGMFVISSLSKSLVVMGLAVVVLAGALKLLSSLKMEEIDRGMNAMARMLIVVVGMAAVMGKAGKGIAVAGLAMIPLAIGITILATSLKLLATMNWDEIYRGTTALAGIMSVLAITLNSMGVVAPVAAAGLLIASIALTAIAGVMKIFATMSWEEIGKSMAGLAGSLLILGLALAGISATGLLGAAALLIVAPALLALGATMTMLGKLSWKEIAKGLVALGGALVILAIGLTGMIVALPGAAALLVAAPALLILATVLATLGALKWSSILKGLVAIAGLFVVLGAAGALMGPVIPVLLGLSVVLLGMGAAFLLAGGGMLLFSMALSNLAVTGKEGGEALITLVKGFINLIPIFVAKIGEGMVKALTLIVTAAPQIAAAVAAVATKLLDELNKLIPKMATTFTNLIQAGLRVVRTLSPDIIETGFQLLMDFLHGIEKHIGEIGNTVVNIIEKFVDEVGTEKNITRLAESAADLLINFLNGLSNAIDSKSGKIQSAAGKLVGAIGAAILKSPFNFASGLADKIVGEGNKALEWAKGILGGGKGKKDSGGDDPKESGRKTVGRYIEGVQEGWGSAEDAGRQVVNKTLGAISTALDGNTSLTPVIAPVLDLSTLQTQAAGIGSLLSSTPTISTATAYSQASGIANEVENFLASLDYSAPTEPSVYLEQNNYSPKSLSEAEIYLNTQNQLSLAKEALKS